MKNIIVLSILTSTLLMSSSDIFTLDVRNYTTDDSYRVTSNNLEDILNGIDRDTILDNISYNETNDLRANLDFRGLPVTLRFIDNSTELIFSVPSLGITETFTGTTRDDSIDMLEDWFKENGAQTVEKIMKELARVSPVDPIAGNPSSLMGTTVSNDFQNGFTRVATQHETQHKNLLIVAPTYKALETDGKHSDSFTLPLGYSFSSEDNPKKSFNISLPITYTSVEGAKSYNIGFGASYSYPIKDEWIITPGIGYSIVGSADLGALAQLASASLTSSYKFDLEDNHFLSIGNMIGYYSTVKFYDGDYAYDPDIQNTVFRNALMYSLPTENIHHNTSVDIFAIDTRYTGTELFLNSYEEIGFSFGYNKVNLNILSDKKEYSFEHSLKLGLSYLTSSKSDGFKINFGFIF